jgi:hypothetical protein
MITRIVLLGWDRKGSSSFCCSAADTQSHQECITALLCHQHMEKTQHDAATHACTEYSSRCSCVTHLRQGTQSYMWV